MKRLLFVVMQFIVTGVLSAQGLSVSSFCLLDTDITAITQGTQEIDQNGEVAALIKVVTRETGFTFDVGTVEIVKTQQAVGEIWVYVPKRTQKISIFHQQYGALRNYYFPVPIESGRTYELKLEVQKEESRIEEKVGYKTGTDSLFYVAENKPEFPGGTRGLTQFLKMNIKYPSVCFESGIQGRVVVQFIVNKDGFISDIEVIKSVHPDLDKEAVRIVQEMPKWKPGMQNGKKVRVIYTLPISFKLTPVKNNSNDSIPEHSKEK